MFEPGRVCCPTGDLEVYLNINIGCARMPSIRSGAKESGN
jgi:hypothetical protein